MGKHGTPAAVGALLGALVMTLVFLGQPDALPGGGDVLVESLLVGLFLGGPTGLFLGYMASRIREVSATPSPPALPPARSPYSPYPAQRPTPPPRGPFPVGRRTRPPGTSICGADWCCSARAR